MRHHRYRPSDMGDFRYYRGGGQLRQFLWLRRLGGRPIVKRSTRTMSRRDQPHFQERTRGSFLRGLMRGTPTPAPECPMVAYALASIAMRLARYPTTTKPILR